MSNLYSESERIKTLESRIFALKDEVARMKAEWIDPQRIVDLAKRYTDEGITARASIEYVDCDPYYIGPWQATVQGNVFTGSTATDALKEAEA